MSNILSIYEFNARTLKELANNAQLNDIIKTFPFWVKDDAVKLAMEGNHVYNFNFIIEKNKWARELVYLNENQINYICDGFTKKLEELGFFNIKVEYCTETLTRHIHVEFEW